MADLNYVEADRVARAFHEAYETHAHEFGYTTRKASAVAWESVPENNKALMRTVITKLEADGVIVVRRHG